MGTNTTRGRPMLTSEELAYERDLVMMILTLIRHLHSGATLAGALIELTRESREHVGFTDADKSRDTGRHVPGLVQNDIAIVVGLVRSGQSLTDALTAWKVQRQSQGVDLFVAACSLNVERGGSLIDSLLVLQNTISAQIELHDEVRTATTQSKASLVALALLPVFGTFIFMIVDPGVLSFYVSSPTGILCLGIGVALIFGGWRLSQKMIQQAVSL